MLSSAIDPNRSPDDFLSPLCDVGMATLFFSVLPLIVGTADPGLRSKVRDASWQLREGEPFRSRVLPSGEGLAEPNFVPVNEGNEKRGLRGGREGVDSKLHRRARGQRLIYD